MTIQWLMAARKIGKRLALLEPPALSELSEKTHEVICGVAGCVVKRKKLGGITGRSPSSVNTPDLVSTTKKPATGAGRVMGETETNPISH